MYPAVGVRCSGTTLPCDDQYFGYDAMGRLKHMAGTAPPQWALATPDAVDATYDLGGRLTELDYPGGLKVTQTYDSDGRLSSVGSIPASGAAQPQYFMQPAVYNPDGTPNVMTLGNGVQQTLQENSRLQVQSVSVATPLPPLNANAFFSHTYCYSNCSTGGTANNGSIWGIADNLNSSRTQGFTYDPLNRLTSFSLGGAVQQQFAIDSYGNASLPTTYSGIPYSALADPSNRLYRPCADPANPAPGTPSLAYDAAGNQLCDSDPNQAKWLYYYDVESRLIQVAMVNSPPFTSNTYDAAGNRIRVNNTDGTWTEYNYFGGHEIFERDQAGNTTNFVYAGGAKIATVRNTDNSIHLHAANQTVVDECGARFNVPGTGYPIKAGDMLSWRENNQGTAGGLNLYTDTFGLQWQYADTNGIIVNQDYRQGWVNRTMDLSPFAGHPLLTLEFLKDFTYGLGNWDIWYGDLAVTSSDGTVTPLFVRGSSPAFTLSGCQSSGTPLVSEVTSAAPVPDPGVVSYTFGDQVGTAQMEFSSGGWPVWQGQFGPFGQELDTQMTANQDKFAGLKRDSVTGSTTPRSATTARPREGGCQPIRTTAA